MKQKIVIEGRETDIDIRPMDESFVVYRKMYEPPITPANIGKGNPVIEDFFRKQIRLMGSCAILAWEGDGVIGKMHFTTKEMQDALQQAGGCYCVDEDAANMAETLQAFSDDDLEELLASKSRTLSIVCFNIGHFDTRYHGQGIASAMVEVLKEWARERGWRRLQVFSYADILPFRLVGPHILRKGWPEQRGFCVAEVTQMGPDAARTVREAVEEIVSGPWDEDAWDVKSYRFNLEKVRALASDPASMSDHDKEYVMVCDL